MTEPEAKEKYGDKVKIYNTSVSFGYTSFFHQVLARHDYHVPAELPHHSTRGPRSFTSPSPPSPFLADANLAKTVSSKQCLLP
jgi:hypothetical protein